jgi:phospholipid transport system substrate-binding protein
MTLHRRNMLSFMLGSAMLLGAVGSAVAFDAPAPNPAAAAVTGPQELVEASARKMLQELDANRAMYRKDAAKLDNLVATVLLPYFDSEYAARLVLGQHWRAASEDQRKRFIDAFYHSLLRNYGSALVDFTADRMTMLPFHGDASGNSATVRTEIKRENGTKVPVNYSMRKTDAGWKAWDVTIEGVSYVKSFRTDLGTEVQQKGLDAVIARLESESAAPTAPASGSSAK